MPDLSELTKHYLLELRTDERFKILLEEISVPAIPIFNPRKENKSGTWEYYSGKIDGHNAVVSILRGTTNE